MNQWIVWGIKAIGPWALQKLAEWLVARIQCEVSREQCKVRYVSRLPKVPPRPARGRSDNRQL